MRGPYLITALPDDLSGITYELVKALHRAATQHGKPVSEELKALFVRLPEPVYIGASTRPDHIRLSIRRLPSEVAVLGDLAMIFLTADGQNYILMHTGVAIADLQRIAEELGSDPDP